MTDETQSFARYTRKELRNAKIHDLLSYITRQEDVVFPKRISVKPLVEIKKSRLIDALVGPYGYHKGPYVRADPVEEALLPEPSQSDKVSNPQSVVTGFAPETKYNVDPCVGMTKGSPSDEGSSSPLTSLSSKSAPATPLSLTFDLHHTSLEDIPSQHVDGLDAQDHSPERRNHHTAHDDNRHAVLPSEHLPYRHMSDAEDNAEEEPIRNASTEVETNDVEMDIPSITTENTQVEDGQGVATIQAKEHTSLDEMRHAEEVGSTRAAPGGDPLVGTPDVMDGRKAAGMEKGVAVESEQRSTVDEFRDAMQEEEDAAVDRNVHTDTSGLPGSVGFKETASDRAPSSNTTGDDDIMESGKEDEEETKDEDVDAVMDATEDIGMASDGYYSDAAIEEDRSHAEVLEAYFNRHPLLNQRILAIDSLKATRNRSDADMAKEMKFLVGMHDYLTCRRVKKSEPDLRVPSAEVQLKLKFPKSSVVRARKITEALEECGPSGRNPHPAVLARLAQVGVKKGQKGTPLEAFLDAYAPPKSDRRKKRSEEEIAQDMEIGRVRAGLPSRSGTSG